MFNNCPTTSYNCSYCSLPLHFCGLFRGLPWSNHLIYIMVPGAAQLGGRCPPPSPSHTHFFQNVKKCPFSGMKVSFFWNDIWHLVSKLSCLSLFCDSLLEISDFLHPRYVMYAVSVYLDIQNGRSLSDVYRTIPFFVVPFHLPHFWDASAAPAWYWW